MAICISVPDQVWRGAVASTGRDLLRCWVSHDILVIPRTVGGAAPLTGPGNLPIRGHSLLDEEQSPTAIMDLLAKWETAMSIRAILVGASGGTASDGAIDLACRLALRVGAHLQGYHVKSDPSDVIIAASMDGPGMPIHGSWIERSIEHADKLAARTRAAFFQATERHGLTQFDKPQAGIANGASVEWREETGSGTALIAAQARFFDLIVLGRSDRVIDQPASDVIEGTLVQSGRPVLLAPATPPVTIGETIAIGWDGSPRSVRAITAALPLLRHAKKTVIIAIDDDPDTASTAPITDYLGWHGIASDGQQLRAVAGVGRGEQLLSAARDTGADLLAMGAFGQSRWRQMLFGSATQTVVSTSLLSILMTH